MFMDPLIYEQSIHLIAKASYMYYIQSYSQSRISSELNISMSTVSRLLKKSRNRRVIEITLAQPYKKCIEIENQLCEAFNIEVLVVPLDFTQPFIDSFEKAIALEGARYLQQKFRKGNVIGLGWGRIIHYMVHYLNPSQRFNSKFVIVNGSLGRYEPHMDLATLYSRIDTCSDAQKEILYLDDIFAENEKEYINVKNKQNNKMVNELIQNMTVSISDMGSFCGEEEIIKPYPFLSHKILDELRAFKAYGDVMYRFFDKDGHECNTSLKNRTYSLEWDTYKKIPVKIVMASGAHKAKALRALLAGKLADVVIIDEFLALELLRLK